MSIGQRRATLTLAGVLVAVLCRASAAAAPDGGAGALQSAHPPLIRAAAARRDAEVRRLIERGADPNVRDKFSRTALEILLAKGAPADLIRLLISHGADVTVQGESLTPVGTAIYFCHAEGLELLLREGARLDIPVGWQRPGVKEFASRHGCPAVREIIERAASASPECTR
jgi:ankyrin repeat protein